MVRIRAGSKQRTSFRRNKRFKKEILRALKTGAKTTVQLYKILKQRCPKYCNDSEICTHHKLTGTHQPEWKHKVRNVLHTMQKKFLIYLDKGTGEWKIIE